MSLSWYSLLLTGLLSLYSALLPAQGLDQLLGPPVLTLSALPPCQLMAVDGERNLLLLDAETNKLYKFFALTGYDSSISIGGKGNRDEGLLQATKLSVYNRQTLYVLDEGSQRLLLFSPNFRLLESIDLLTFSGQAGPGESLYPISFEVSGIGELFLLNQWDNKVYKFSPGGTLERVFGGLDYGEGSLYEPIDLQVTPQNLIFVSDTSAQEFKVFDLFGRYRYAVRPKVAFRWQYFLLEADYLLCWNNAALYFQHLPSKKSWQVAIPGLQAAALDREFLYLLQENRVHLYRLKGS